MPLNVRRPIIYLITSGATTARTTPASKEFFDLTQLISAATSAEVDLLQIREKKLTDRTLYEMSVRAAALTRGSATRVLVNDRADIARAAGVDGVHLTTRSMKAAAIRQAFGEDFLIGSSTHSLRELEAAREGGADFAVFGPVYATESKQTYGEPLGVAQLRDATSQLETFPILALGGVTLDNAAECFSNGAAGIAAIRLLNDLESLARTVDSLRNLFPRANRS